MTPETDLGREVRKEVADILAKYSGPHEAIAGVKVSTLRKIDAVLNPPADTFRIPTERCDAVAYEVMSETRIERLLFGAAQ